MLKHSIKLKITFLLAGLIACLVILILVLNNTFSERVYIKGKQNAMLDSYNKINEIMNSYSSGQKSDNEMCSALEQVSSGMALQILVVNSDWSTVYATSMDDAELQMRLRKSIFNGDIFKEIKDAEKLKEVPSSQEGENSDNRENGNSKYKNRRESMDDPNAPNFSINKIDMNGNGVNENREIIIEECNYTLQKIYDTRLQDDYLELWGTLDNGNSIILRTPIQGIKDNVKISNTFIKNVGMAILIIGVIIAFIISNYITKPIKQLSDVAERMAEMDFDAKYEGNHKDEIGILGKSMNNMSDKLEKNISDLKKANLELKRDIDKKEKLEQMRTDFLSNVSHELKTPIALIQGYAEGLKEGITDDPESMDYYCDVIIDEANKMNSMVKKLLTLNQLEFGKADLTVERFNLSELIASVVNSNELRANQKDATIYFEESKKPIYVWSDEYKVEEILTNYISNAINHTDSKKPISVRTECNDNGVRVIVYNSGNNIPEEDIDRIWEKFYKVDKARTREYGGNGIGLSIVKAIMDSMGKECGVKNVSDGVEFWFELDNKS